MQFWKLFITALMPVLKVLLITALGAFLALDRFNVLRDTARKHLNTVVHAIEYSSNIHSWDSIRMVIYENNQSS
ncbi:hypothetical protein S245_067302 [Arachis hypogaea]